MQATAQINTVQETASNKETVNNGFFFENTIRSIGKIFENGPIQQTVYSFINQSDKPIAIHKIVTTCGCTTAFFEERPYKPTERGEIKLTFDPHRKLGVICQQVFIYTSESGNKPAATLELTGEVVSENEFADFATSIGNLRIKQHTPTLSGISRDKQSIERLLCANSGKQPLVLKVSELPEYVSFKTDPEIIAPGQEADMLFTIDGNKLPPDVKESFFLNFMLEGPDVPEADRFLTVKVVLCNNKNQIISDN
ncbi:MAG: DUF1573 domain-containing protein [Bacteroidales bacterium]